MVSKTTSNPLPSMPLFKWIPKSPWKREEIIPWDKSFTTPSSKPQSSPPGTSSRKNPKKSSTCNASSHPSQPTKKPRINSWNQTKNQTHRTKPITTSKTSMRNLWTRRSTECRFYLRMRISKLTSAGSSKFAIKIFMTIMSFNKK